MKILHIGDIHCDTKNLKLLKKEVEKEKIDMIAVDGDVECDGEILMLIERLGKNIYFVPGNMDDVAISKLYEQKGYNIDAKIRQIDNDIIIAGIGGLSIYSSLQSIKKKLSRPEYKMKQIIILAHHPPKSKTTDLALGKIHAGLTELNELITIYEPILFMHGHIHESPGHEKIGNTIVVNAGPLAQGRYAVIDLDTLTVENKKIVP